MKPFSRAERVGGQIQRELADVIQKEIGDPRLGMATITGVQVTRDLRLARIYFAVNGDAAAQEAARQGFQQARGFLKKMLSPRLGLRYMPDLQFFYDDTFDHAARIDRLLKTLNPSP